MAHQWCRRVTPQVALHQAQCSRHSSWLLIDVLVGLSMGRRGAYLGLPRRKRMSALQMMEGSGNAENKRRARREMQETSCRH